MAYLIGVTLLWAFSFSLIGVYLAGAVDPYFAVLVRLTLACLLFAPLMRWRDTDWRRATGLMGVGVLQIGLMYTFFYQSFEWLSVPEVLLFTIFTPIYVTVLEDMLRARFTPVHLLSAVLAVAGAALIRYQGISEQFWGGFLIVQGANLCFAAGQVGYRRLVARWPAERYGWRDFGWFFVGAWPVVAVLFATLGDYDALPGTFTQWGVLLWLGLAASGLGYYLWNLGAERVDVATLAVMNNALIPAGLAVNLLIWNHDAPLGQLASGSAVILAALVLNACWQRRSASAAGSLRVFR